MSCLLFESVCFWTVLSMEVVMRGTVLYYVVFERFVILPILEEIIQFDKHVWGNHPI